jgi:hypothetical protein
MARTTRFQYFERLPFRRRKISFDEALGMVKRQIKRKAVADGLIVDPATRPPKCQWAWECPPGTISATYNMKDGELLSVTENPTSGVVAANTRSEARSLIKKQLGVSKKDRLPAGIVITKVEVEGSAS